MASHIRKASQGKGIFTIEGHWGYDLRNPMTIQPALELLRTVEGVDFIHQKCATDKEFMYYLRQWSLNRYSGYPILYLLSHGKEFGINLVEKFITLDEIAGELADKCSNRIIMVSSCSTMAIDKRHLKRFLKFTNALMICGYRDDVDWLRSAAFEILILSEIQRNEFSGRGIEAIRKRMTQISNLFPELNFRVVINNE